MFSNLGSYATENRIAAVIIVSMIPLALWGSWWGIILHTVLYLATTISLVCSAQMRLEVLTGVRISGLAYGLSIGYAALMAVINPWWVIPMISQIILVESIKRL